MDHAGDGVGNVMELEVKENGRRWSCSLYSSDSLWAERTEEFETELDAHAVERGQRRTEGDGILFVGRVDGDEEAWQHRSVNVQGEQAVHTRDRQNTTTPNETRSMRAARARLLR